jgi:glycosyltransferase involved in cell wall biosynthesis
VRILQITSAKTFGGGERHLVDLCRGMMQRGHEIFVALRPTNEWQDKLEFLPKENRLYVSLRNSFGVLSAKRIARFIREKDIQIVHAHVARDYIPASLASMLVKSARFVLTRHVLFPLQPFNRIALKNLSRAIAVSSAVEASLQKVFPPNKIATIPNGIDIDNWAGRDRQQLRKEFRFFHGIPFDAPLIGTVGELIVLKGQRDFVLAANEAAKKFPDAHFVVVGKDNSLDKSFRRELKRLVKVFGLEERFLWLDWVEDTAPLLSALDIFVSASHSESFGLAILEAMASGTAVIATETAGAKELLGTEGVFVPVKDPVALGERMCIFLSDAERSRALGERCREMATQKFSLDRMLNETEKLYEAVLKN